MISQKLQTSEITKITKVGQTFCSKVLIQSHKETINCKFDLSTHDSSLTMNETILERDEILHYYGSNMRITFSKVHLFCLLVLKCSDKLITTSYKKKV